jgi:ABC-2 type transport system ATP-binding protein
VLPEQGEEGSVLLRVERAAVPAVTARLLAEHPVADLTIEDPPIEDVIEQVFATERDDERDETSV